MTPPDAPEPLDGPGQPAGDSVARRAQIVVLLDTRNDNLPEVTRRQDGGEPGFTHGKLARLSCPDCLTNDKPMIGCETCGGRGFVEVKRDHDPYANQNVKAFGFDDRETDRRVAIDAAISAAGRDLRRFPGFRPAGTDEEIEEANNHPYAWELARRRMYRDYDYRALDVALDALRHEHPGLSPYTRIGLKFLDRRMPNPIRSPEPSTGAVKNTKARGPNVDERALAQRDTLICHAVLVDGDPVAQVALRFELSVSQVNRIVKATTA